MQVTFGNKTGKYSKIIIYKKKSDNALISPSFKSLITGGKNKWLSQIGLKTESDSERDWEV